MNKGGSALRASVHPSVQWESLYQLPREDQTHSSDLYHTSCRQLTKSPPTGLSPAHTWAPTAHGQCPEQPAFGWPLHVPPAFDLLNPRSRGCSKKGPTLSGCSGAPARWFHSFPRLSTPPRNTTSLHGPMLVHLRNKTQKQIKWQFFFKQERGQASGVPGQRPLVPTPGGHFPPLALAVLKPRPPCGLHQP